MRGLQSSRGGYQYRRGCHKKVFCNLIEVRFRYIIYEIAEPVVLITLFAVIIDGFAIKRNGERAIWMLNLKNCAILICFSAV